MVEAPRRKPTKLQREVLIAALVADNLQTSREALQVRTVAGLVRLGWAREVGWPDLEVTRAGAIICGHKWLTVWNLKRRVMGLPTT